MSSGGVTTTTTIIGQTTTTTIPPSTGTGTHGSYCNSDSNCDQSRGLCCITGTGISYDNECHYSTATHGGVCIGDGSAGGTPGSGSGTTSPVGAGPCHPIGDVNNDGKVNSIDSTIILQYDSKILTTIDSVRADVTGDERVNSLDAQVILQYTSGAIGIFPACPTAALVMRCNQYGFDTINNICRAECGVPACDRKNPFGGTSNACKSCTQICNDKCQLVSAAYYCLAPNPQCRCTGPTQKINGVDYCTTRCSSSISSRCEGKTPGSTVSGGGTCSGSCTTSTTSTTTTILSGGTSPLVGPNEKCKGKFVGRFGTSFYACGPGECPNLFPDVYTACFGNVPVQGITIATNLNDYACGVNWYLDFGNSPWTGVYQVQDTGGSAAFQGNHIDVFCNPLTTCELGVSDPDRPPTGGNIDVYLSNCDPNSA